MRKRWLGILGVMVILMVLVGGYTSASPRYRGRAEIEITSPRIDLEEFLKREIRIEEDSYGSGFLATIGKDVPSRSFEDYILTFKPSRVLLSKSPNEEGVSIEIESADFSLQITPYQNYATPINLWVEVQIIKHYYDEKRARADFEKIYSAMINGWEIRIEVELRWGQGWFSQSDLSLIYNVYNETAPYYLLTADKPFHVSFIPGEISVIEEEE